MNSQEFIINKLNNFITLFPKLIFKYKYDKIKLIHIIEVSPLEEFNNNDDYLIAEANLVYAFDNKFIPETILFISEESLTKIEKPDVIFSFKSYGLFLDNLNHMSNMRFNNIKEFIYQKKIKTVMKYGILTLINF